MTEERSVPVNRPSEAEIDAAFEDMKDGRARCIKQLHPDVPVGKIYASAGLGAYWLKKKYGYVEHNPRGTDLSARKNSMANLAQVYERRTGRTAVDHMEKELAFIERLEEMALQIEDPEKAIIMMEKVVRLQQVFNKTWAPYLQPKQGTLRVEQTYEQSTGLDDLLNGKVIEHEDRGSE